MRSILCVGLLLLVAVAIVNAHEFLSSSIQPMFQLIVGSLTLSLGGVFIAFRLIERKVRSQLLIFGSGFVTVFLFFATWNLLWKSSEEALTAFYERQGSPTDVGYSYFYPGASGIGYAQGFTDWKTDTKEFLLFGFFPALLLSGPIGLVLSWGVEQGEQDAAPQIRPRWWVGD